MTGVGARPDGAPNAKRFVSVGTKLSLSISVLVLIAAAAVYVGLSRYERENLLAAKDRTAQALMQLFTASLVAPIAFEDDNSVKDTVENLGKNPEVVLARVWSLDGHNLGRRMGELARARDVPATTTPPKAQRVARTPTSLLLEAPVIGPTGETIGAAQVAFSLDRENKQIAAIERRVLGVSAATAVIVWLLLVILARTLIIRPLTKLSDAAKQLEAGNHVKLSIGANDEVGQLAMRLQSMADAIAQREERIKGQNRDMRLVLDNVDQGILTIDRGGNLDAAHSKTLDRWFGPPRPDAGIVEYFGSIEAELGIWFQIGWEAVLEDILPLELTLDQLPKRFTKSEMFYELKYRPIFDDAGQLQKALIVIDDVTRRVHREQTDADQRQMLVIFHHLVSTRHTFEEFLGEAREIMTRLETVGPKDAVLAKRLIHTLKGNAAIFGLDVVSTTCHVIESRMEDSGDPLSDEERRAVRLAWEPVEAAVQRLALSGPRQGIELEKAEYENFLRAVHGEVSHGELASIVASWRFEPAGQRLEAQGELIRNLGKRLQKEVQVTIEPTQLRIPARKWAPFWSSFAHIVRNALDHGIETPDERSAAGKPPTGHIKLALVSDEDKVELHVSDDGRGIAWEAIARKAEQRGMPHASRNDLVEAMFADSFSTREEATEVSGRGVGLGAVREAVLNMKGHIQIESEPGRGSTFRFVFPRSVLKDEPSLSMLPPRSPLASLRPGAVRASVPQVGLG